MGLGGLTRDSIIGLSDLVHEDDDGDAEYELQGHRRNLSLNNGSKKNTGNSNDEFLFLDDDHQPADQLMEQSVCLASLNDNSGGISAPSTPAAATTLQQQYQPQPPQQQQQDVLRSPKASSGSSAAAYQFQYEGYTDYYAEDFSPYNYDNYGSSDGQEKTNVFCCLFPWMAAKDNQEIQNENSQLESSLTQSTKQETETESLNKKDLPKKLSQDTAPVNSTNQVAATSLNKSSAANSDKQSIIAASSPAADKTESTHASKIVQDSKPSISAAPPKLTATQISTQVSASSDTSSDKENKCVDSDKLTSDPNSQLQNDDADSGPPPVKSILKVKHAIHTIEDNDNHNNTKKTTTPSSKDGKRHLFPSYEPKQSNNMMNNGTTSDATTANDASQPSQKKTINFNPMARVLTIPSRKDIPLSQKSQIWWQKCDYDEFKKTGRIISKAMECGGSEIWLNSSNAWGNRQQSKQLKDSANNTTTTSTTNTVHASLNNDEYSQALRKYGVNEEKKDEDNSNSSGNKWWCKFGHSRRGLEHIASNEEGKARQQSVLLAIRMVLEEQKRQRIARTKDPNKLRTTAIQYTSWARDLSLAAAAADAEAVKTNFDSMAKSRAHYFAKRLSGSSNAGASSSDHNAVGGGVAKAVTSQILDANTHAKSTSTIRRSSAITSSSVSTDSEHPKVISKMAKGFMGGGEEGNDMSAVLSGMGTRATVKA